MIVRILSLLLILTLTACDRQGAQWEEAQQEDTIAAYEVYAERYPDGPNAEQARSRIEALRAGQAWTNARQQNTIEAYREFLETHPDAADAETARERLQPLEREAAWQDLAGSEVIDALQTFVADYAGSSEAELARARISELETRAEAERREQELQREREQELARERERELEAQREAQRQAEQGTHRVQLAVLSDQERANAGLEQIQQRLGDVLGDVGLEAQPTNGRYRLVTQAMSYEQADTLCATLQQRDQDCFVRER